MMKTLREDDAQALDLLLEEGLDFARTDITSLDEATVNRVGIVESMLRVVGEMPAEDPPHDLVSRTLAFVYAGSLAAGQMPDAGTGING